MRRTEVRVALALAAVVGVIVGVVLFNQLGPFPSPSGGESAGPSGSPTPSGTTTGSPSSAPSTPTASSPPPSSTEPSPTESSDPDFTEQALVQPDHLLERGWETAGVVNTWEEVPPEQITQCDHPPTDLGVEQAFAATTDGTAEGEQQISMAEVVMRFPDEATAGEAMMDLVGRINSCELSPPGESRLTPDDPEHPEPDDKVDDAVLWSASGEDGQVLAMVGLVRASDRIAFFSLISFGKDGAEPLDPFAIEGLDADELTIYAGRRLV